MARNIRAVISHTYIVWSNIKYRCQQRVVTADGSSIGAANENSDINVLLLHARYRSKGGHIFFVKIVLGSDIRLK